MELKYSFGLFIYVAIVALLSFSNASRDKRQVVYLDGDYPRPFDPAAIDPEVLREIENEKRAKYYGSGPFHNGFYHGAFSEISELIDKNPDEVARKIIKRSTDNEEEEDGIFSEDWSEKEEKTLDHLTSSSRFRPLHGPRRGDDPRSYRRGRSHHFDGERPRFRPNRFFQGKRVPENSRDYYRESQQSRKQENERSFKFPGSGSIGFLSQFASLFKDKQAKKAYTEADQQKEASNNILGSGNFEVLSGGIYPDEDDINDYESIKHFSNSNQRNYFHDGPPYKHFDATRRFLHRHYTGGGFSEKHEVKTENKVKKEDKKETVETPKEVKSENKQS